MRALIVACVATSLLATAGCSASSSGSRAEAALQGGLAAARDEPGFLKAMQTVEGADLFSDADLLAAGDAACESAADQDISIMEALGNLKAYAISEKGADESTLAYFEGLHLSAGVHLCPGEL